MSGWSCPNEVKGNCEHVPDKKCDPGMKGCVLFGKFRFANTEKNSPRRERERQEAMVRDSEALTKMRG
ncbi:hypothetical protein MTBPR1_10027 [Candidatus Terasakiella magnetica]|uniref:Uncharacterized protein n=1 Tax=Candidatus Terasakiella magnetica TaxID=1867952 RepID=A0A1C3RBZ0_9PROT|nr:hypothetical protein [Candidatus Terasakiella magnetica]SCA54780.1 hypothetical protein MTBPR1_10027 [Candidatus Terasakiella magnetica]